MPSSEKEMNEVMKMGQSDIKGRLMYQISTARFLISAL